MMDTLWLSMDRPDEEYPQWYFARVAEFAQARKVPFWYVKDHVHLVYASDYNVK